MTIKEFIAELSDYDEDLHVYMLDSDGDDKLINGFMIVHNLDETSNLPAIYFRVDPYDCEEDEK